MKRFVASLCVCFLVGCSDEPSPVPAQPGTELGASSPLPASKPAGPFSLAISEYPSWSVFYVAHQKGLINAKAGELGPIEKKWNVDIELKEADYDTCITLYGSATVDAACLTNLDTFAPAGGRPAVAILPTSTSVGADANVVVGVADLEALKAVPTYGLEKSVSQYTFERNLVLKGQNPKDYTFKNMDPAAASQAMQTNQNGINSIVVWNPFVLQTLRTRKDAKVLFDSASIPEEIIDCVMVGRDSLKKPGGEDFACAVIDTYYSVCNLIRDPKTSDETLVATGAKFSSLGLDDMKLVVSLGEGDEGATRFYSTADAGIGLFTNVKFQKEIMPAVHKFCIDHEIVNTQDAVYGFEVETAPLNFTTKFMDRVKTK